MKTALFLTLARLAICPIFLVIYLFYPTLGISLHFLPYFLLVLLILCELSDALDGYVARKVDGVTQLGKVLDPMADSIVRLSFLFCFTQGLIKLPVLLVVVFLFRESIISTLRTLCALRGIALAARWSGKIKAILQAVCVFAIVLMIIPYSMGIISLMQLREMSYYFVLFTAAYTVVSGIEYIWVCRAHIRASAIKG